MSLCQPRLRKASRTKPTVSTAYLVFIVRMQVDTALLGLPPMLRDRLVLVRLVNDLGDDLGSLLDQARVGRRDVRTVDGVRRGILHQECQESKDAPHKQRYDNEIDEDKDQGAAPHGERAGRPPRRSHNGYQTAQNKKQRRSMS